MTSLSPSTSEDDYSDLWDSDLDAASADESTTPSLSEETTVSSTPSFSPEPLDGGSASNEAEDLLVDAIQLLQLALTKTRRAAATETDSSMSSPEPNSPDQPEQLSSFLPGKNRGKLRAVGGFILRASGGTEGQ